MYFSIDIHLLLVYTKTIKTDTQSQIFIFLNKHPAPEATKAYQIKQMEVFKMKRLKCKKEFGVWHYETITPAQDPELEAPTYELYDSNMVFQNTFGSYGDMIYFVKTGIVL